MPTVTLSRYECANDLLPAVCATCGRPATARVSHKFAWNPRWAEWLPLGSWILSRRMAVRLPTCPRHVRQRRWKNLFVILAFLPFIGMVTGALVYDLLRPPGPGDRLVTMRLLYIEAAVLIVGVVIAQAISGRIHPTQITERQLTLDGVHDAFVDALVEDRARSSDPLRTVGYGDVRDDYDEPDGAADRPATGPERQSSDT